MNDSDKGEEGRIVAGRNVEGGRGQLKEERTASNNRKKSKKKQSRNSLQYSQLE